MKKIMTRLLSLVLLGTFIPGFVLADNWYLENGDITVTATEASQTVSQGSTTKPDSAPIISNSSGGESSASTNNTVTIKAEGNATANVTLENVNIDTGTRGGAAITTSGEGNVNIELDGTNTVQSGNDHAGVEKKGDGTLTITDENKDGSLTATGGTLGAGIGGGYCGSGNNITIEGGKIEANGGNFGAGIGGGQGGSGSGITIKGGNVTAQSRWSGAGIGGGGGGSGNNITISDGEVTAKGGTFGAGIGGGGDGGGGNNITIDGGKVTAQGGNNGAGIGGGFRSNGIGITISGDAQVKAQGGAEYSVFKEGAAIGNGGTPTTEGNEVSPNTSDLTVDGFIQIYEPGKNINTDTPYKTIEGQKGDHSWNAGEVTTPATCTTEGVRTYTCTKNPAHTKTEPIPALNHQFGAYTFNNNATCTQDGTETAKCERCNETDTRTKAGTKLGHLFETYVYNNDATTKADGTETAHCAHPGCTVTDTRTVKGTKLTEHTAETVPESKAAAYWVCDPEGQSIPYQAQQKDGVLTVTVQADTASLRGTTGSLGQLEAQGITKILFVTNGAQSAFVLSDLLASGSGSVTLTHEGEKVTFTLADTDISGIIQ